MGQVIGETYDPEPHITLTAEEAELILEKQLRPGNLSPRRTIHKPVFGDLTNTEEVGGERED